MSLSDFLKYYRLSPKELKSILKVNGLNDNIRVVNTVPEEWIELLSKHTGLLMPEFDMDARSKKIAKPGLKGMKLSSFESLEKLKTVENEDIFIAFVKYLAEDGSHAYLKRIKSVNELYGLSLYDKNEDDFKLHYLPSSLKKDQLVICTSKSDQLKKVKIQSTQFQGTVNKEKYSFTDWVSLADPIHFSDKVNFIGEFSHNELVDVELVFKNRSIQCKIISEASDKDDIKFSLKENFKMVLKGELSMDYSLNLISSFLAYNDITPYQSSLDAIFKKEASNRVNYSDDKSLDLFLEKWKALCPKLITIESFKSEINYYLFLDFWLKGKLEIDFFGNRLIDFLLEGVINEPAEKLLYEFSFAMARSNHKSIFIDELQNYIGSLGVIETRMKQEQLHKLVVHSKLLNEEELKEKVNQSLSSTLKFEYWLENEESELPLQYALKIFGQQDSKTQERIIHKLSDQELYGLLPIIKQQSDTNIINRLISLSKPSLFKKLSPISFDIESDTRSISEISWNDNETWQYAKKSTDVALTRFRAIAASTEYLLLGHNIIDFDCPILEKKGIEFQKDNLWDTFLMEMLLSPDLRNFALRTNHNALDDAKLALELFINQVLHIIKMSEDDFMTIVNCLPKEIAKKIKTIRNEHNYAWLDLGYVLDCRKRFYRPQPRIDPLVRELSLRLNESSAITKIVLGPNLYQHDLFSVSKLMILHDEKSSYDFELINKELVSGIPEEQNWQRQLLLRYLSYCGKHDLLPYWGNLAPAVKIRLTNELEDINSLLSPLGKPDWQINNTLFLSIGKVREFRDALSKCENLEFFLLNSNLLSIENKELIKQIDFEQIISGRNSSQIWMKFSGGQSFVGLTENQVRVLSKGNESIYDNYWVEKYQYGQYRLYGNSNWEKLIESIPHNRKTIDPINQDKAISCKLHYVLVNSSSAKGSAIVRFNPESIYRSRYWVFQGMLVDQIDSSKSPSILLVQRPEEIEELEMYFQSRGYFIPANSMTIGRRLEMLHLNKSRKRLLIISQYGIGRVLHANYLGSLNIILDSFSLGENIFKAKNTSYYNSIASISIDRTESNNGSFEDQDLIEDRPKLPVVKDVFFQLKLQAPYVNYLRSIISNYDLEHQLWLLDSRISDFPQLGESWHATRKYLNIWDNPESYEVDAKEADKHIRSARPSNTLPFSHEEIKEILASTFLNDGDHWYDYQEDYLDKILPGKSDLLISLPTGGGKSLLFQSPALFKSTFTNRLTLVITPLKALMEDQVKTLWNMGFLGSVEYINSDRSSDTKLIYRSLAGGELCLLYITPERFRSRGFLNALSMRLKSDGGLEYAVFDEAHCVSQWGHEFRPDYLNSARAINNLKKNSDQEFPILLFSATVSEKVFQDFNLVFHD